VNAISGRQTGDPVRAAHVIVKATESLNPPHRLLPGNDAYEAATKKIEELRKEFSAMEMVSAWLISRRICKDGRLGLHPFQESDF